MRRRGRKGLLALVLGALTALAVTIRNRLRAAGAGAPTAVNLLNPGETLRVQSSGAVASIQEAEIIVPRHFLERI